MANPQNYPSKLHMRTPNAFILESASLGDVFIRWLMANPRGDSFEKQPKVGATCVAELGTLGLNLGQLLARRGCEQVLLLSGHR